MSHAWDRASGAAALLLSNPAADRPSLPGAPAWEMPPDLACTETTPPVQLAAFLQEKTLWVMRWDEPEKQGMQHPAIYRFRPGDARGEALALDFDSAAALPGRTKREERFLQTDDVVFHPSGLVLERSPEFGLWYLPFSEMNAALDGGKKGGP